jgi:hypothetical protein
VAGAVTVTGAMLLLAYGVIRLEHPDRGRPVTAGVLAAGLALLALFVVVERRSATPLVRLGLLRTGPAMRADVAALLFLASFAGFQFLVTLYLQEVRGWSALQTGLAMLIVGVDTVLAPTLTPRLVNRFGNTRVLFGGLLLAVAAYALFLPVGPDWSYAAMLPTMALLGLAFALAYGPVTITAWPAGCSTPASSSAPRSGCPRSPRSVSGCWTAARRPARTGWPRSAPRWWCRWWRRCWRRRSSRRGCGAGRCRRRAMTAPAPTRSRPARADPRPAIRPGRRALARVRR